MSHNDHPHRSASSFTRCPPAGARRIVGKKMTPLQVIAKFDKFIAGSGVQTRLTHCQGIHANPQRVVKMLLVDCVRVYFGANGKLAWKVPLWKKAVKEIIELCL